MNKNPLQTNSLSHLAKSFIKLLIGIAASFVLLFLTLVSFDFSNQLSLPNVFLLLLSPIPIIYALTAISPRRKSHYAQAWEAGWRP